MNSVTLLRSLNYLWILLALGLCDCVHLDFKPENVLPDQTQEGKNTFGCLLDGQIWLPRGSLSLAVPSGIDISYDPSFDGGTLSIHTKNWYRDQIDANISTTQYIQIGLSQVNKPGQYSLNSTDQQGICNYYIFIQQERDKTYLKNCAYDEQTDPRTGSLTITKLDLANHIIAGRFECTLTTRNPQSGCNSVNRITEGRFDLKF